MFGSIHDTMRLLHGLVGLDVCRRYRVPLCRMSARQLLGLYTTSPGPRVLGMSSAPRSGCPRA
jgi:hypothetical protein